MRRRSVALLVLTAAALSVSAAVAITRPGPLAPPEAQARPALGQADARSPEAKALARPLDVFGLGLLRRQAEASPTGNVVVSPASLHAVLADLLNGATAQTAAEMRRALAVTGLSTADVNQGWADLMWLAQSGKRREVSIHDSLWLAPGMPWRRSFLDANRDYYAAQTRELPADANQAAGQINDWVEQNTAGRITNIVSPDMLTSATVLALFNTIYLKVHWQHFDPKATATEPFTLWDGRRIDVPMMHAADLEARVAQTDAYDAVALSTDGPVTAWVIVPKGKATAEGLLGLPDYPASIPQGTATRPLDAEAIIAMQREAKSLTGSLALPRFTTRYEAKGLRGTLASMGMASAFSPAQAQFDGIADVAPERLFISEVVQKTFVEMNEQGVEAAAASGAIMEVTGMRVQGFDVRADHPFLFVLTEKATGAPLFMGLVRDPR